MRTFKLNKLVRDKIFTSMQDLGQKVTYHRLSDEDFLKSLQEKLLEEAKEFNPDDPKAADELADLLEVIEQLGKVLGHDFDALRKIQTERREKRGGFDDRIYVESLELEDNDPWVKYYASEPDRFREKKS